jgi:hypothetical protein
VPQSIKLVSAVFNTTPAVVKFVAFGSAIVLLLKILWLDQIPAWFGRAHELGVLTENVLTATVAASVFFVISYQLPLVVERMAVGPTIAMLADQVVQHVAKFLYAVNHSLNAKDGTATLAQPVTEQTVADLFKRISPNDASPMWDTQTFAVVSWLSTMVDQDVQCRGSIDQIWRYARFIDSELAALLDGIQFSRHAASLHSLKEIGRLAGDLKLGNDNMADFAPAYFQCYQQAMRLQEYCTGFRAKYGIGVTRHSPR